MHIVCFIFPPFFVPKGPQESQEEDSRGSQLQCVLHVWAGSDPGIQRGESCSTNLYFADFTFGWAGQWKWCMNMHDSPPRRALRFKSFPSWKHTATHTHRGFYFFFPLHPLLSSVFPFPLFIVVVCPPVYFPAPGLAAVRLVVCWYESGWCPDIQTVSSVIRLQINCWACPGCRAKTRGWGVGGGLTGYKYLRVSTYKDGTQNIQGRKGNLKQCGTGMFLSDKRAESVRLRYVCNHHCSSQRHSLNVLSCALTSGLHHHGPEQRRLHRQERPEGHFCCSRYVDVSCI